MGGKKLGYDEILHRLLIHGYIPIYDKEWFMTNYKNNRDKIIFADNIGYKYKASPVYICKTHIFGKFNKGNPYTLENISLWLKLNKKSFDLYDKQVYINNNSKLKFICNECKQIFVSTSSSVLLGYGCGVCDGRQISIGYNDLATLRTDLVKYFVNPEDAKLYTVSSGKKIKCKCPDCGYEKEMIISNLSIEGFSCNRCSDGKSIPEKFVFGILHQLGLEFKPEYKINNYRYDFYIPELKLTIETHGSQHYSKRGWYNTLEKEQLNDLNKSILSKSLGNKHIEIDCRKSDYDYLKEQCIKSLYTYFDLSNINWSEVYEYCSTSLMIKTCDLWRTFKNTKTISVILNIHKNTVIRYLKKGKLLNIIDYDPIVVSNNNKKLQSKKVEQYSLDGVLINTFDSLGEASRITKIQKTPISQCCKKLKYHNSAGGFIWKFII
jgi:hypothetical protein